MTEPEDQRQKFQETLKWYAIGCLVTFVAYYVMIYFKMDINNIASCFQISCGILLGAMLQMRSKWVDKK